MAKPKTEKNRKRTVSIAALAAAIALCASIFARTGYLSGREALPELWGDHILYADFTGRGRTESGNAAFRQTEGVKTGTGPEDSVEDGTEQTGSLQNDKVVLKGGVLSVYSDSLIYRSKEEWRVLDMYAFDLTGSGRDELIMLAWKRGSFGTSKPFWIERDDPVWSQHVFVFEYRNGTLMPLWMSSDLGMEVREWSMDDRKRLHLTSDRGTETVWVWDNWGFTLFEEIPGAAASAGAPQSGADQYAEQPGTISGESGEVTMLAVGDNLIHESIYRTCADPKKGTFDFTPIYEHVREQISDYDIAVVNQETPLVEDPVLYGSFPDFGTPAEAGEALAWAGFDVICAATNHVADKGVPGMESTLRLWSRYPEILLLGLHAGADEYNRIDYLERNGVRLALFNYTFGLNGHALPGDESWRVNLLSDEGKLVRDLAAAENAADVSVCFLHAGAEYSAGPTEELRELAKRLTAAGADLIICTHPHVVQRAEIVQATAADADIQDTDRTGKEEGKASGEKVRQSIVCWSLGNFVSNQLNPDTVIGAAADIRISSLPATAAGQGNRFRISCSLRPVVCHFKSGQTQVYFLEDYTDELAASHSLSAKENPLSIRSLTKRWEKVGQEGGLMIDTH